jgi:hypothetical protein
VLNDMRVAQLRELAKSRRVDLSGATRKADIIARLEGHGEVQRCRSAGCDEAMAHRLTGWCVSHYRRYRNAQRAGVRI